MMRTSEAKAREKEEIVGKCDEAQAVADQQVHHHHRAPKTDWSPDAEQAGLRLCRGGVGWFALY